LKALFLKYRSVIKFILTFFVVYGGLSFVYKYYLKFSEGSGFYPDYLTHLVGQQTKQVLQALGYEVMAVPHSTEPSVKLIVNGQYLARVVEGCNSVSVIILFVAFIVAFSGKWKTTFFYILSGSVLIYSVNLLRVVLLSMWLYHYPEYKEVLHAVVFPVIIYGMVFLLWVFWVNRFSKTNRK